MKRVVCIALVIGCGASGAPAETEPARDAATTTLEDAGDPLDPEGCVGCHEEETAGWSGSLHALASVDPLYVAEHAARQSPWCSECHDPRGEERGIDCATCHLVDGAIVSARASGRAPHPTRVVPERATPAACAGCHDFDFPNVEGQPMQDTIDEWHASGAPTCQRCHMPEGDHAFVARRDPSFASRAIEVTVRARPRARSTRVVLTLENHAGHAVPTGDLFRRLAITVTANETTRTVRLARRFRPEHGQLVEIGDDRLAPRERRTLVITLPTRASTVTWSVELEALAPERAQTLDLAQADWRTELARGQSAVVP